MKLFKNQALEDYNAVGWKPEYFQYYRHVADIEPIDMVINHNKLGELKDITGSIVTIYIGDIIQGENGNYYMVDIKGVVEVLCQKKI